MRDGILKKLITFGVLAVVVVAPTQYSFEIRDKTYVSLVDPLVWLVCFLWFADLLRARKLTSIKPPPLFSILFILTAVLSIMRTSNLFSGLKDIFQLVEYFIVAFMLFSGSVSDLKDLKKVLYVFLGTATAVILFGLTQYLDPSIADFKVKATFGNRNVFGGYLAIVLPLMYGLMLFAPDWKRRAWFLLAIVAGLGMTLSGGTFLALSLSLAIISMFKGQRIFLVLVVVLLVGTVFVLPCLPRNNGEVLDESVRVYGDESQVSTRYTEWQAAIAMIRKNPLLGVGMGSYQDNIGRYYGSLPNPVSAAEPDSQNLYLVIASSAGLPGLICFLGMLFFFAAKAAGVFFHSTDWFAKGLALGVLGSIIAFSINCIWCPLLVRGIGVPLALVFSFAGVTSFDGDGDDARFGNGKGND